MSRIYLNDQTCGSGKTYNELVHMVNNRGRYLLAVDRKEAMDDRTATIRSLSAQLGKRVHVVQIKSGDDVAEYRDGDTTIRISKAVRADVEAVPDRHDMQHVIVIITHEALKLSDLAGFRRWALVIDETPSILDQQKVVTTLSRGFLKKHYALVRKGNRFEIKARTNATMAEFRRDSLTHSLTVMHGRVCSDRTAVLTETSSWDRLCKDGAWTWASIWSPDQLAVFERVTILANAFKRSLTYEVMNWAWPEIEWVPHRRAALRVFQPRKMTIRYFAEGHSASRSLFSSDIGKQRLRDIAHWIGSRTRPADHIWTCNEKDASVLEGGITSPKRLRPRQAGSNAYASKTVVSAIYTAKPTPDERRLFGDMGIGASVAIETREFETIFQFVARCAVRDPENSADLTVHVYDREQADYLLDLFEASGYVTCTLELVDLGFATLPPIKGKPGRKPVVMSEGDNAAAAVRKRALAAARKRQQRKRDLQPR